jgi:DivIVA domain-containing protein
VIAQIGFAALVVAALWTRRVRDPITLCAWAAATIVALRLTLSYWYVRSWNTNDALVPALAVPALGTAPVIAGIMLGLAAAAKFGPAAIGPLLAAQTRLRSGFGSALALSRAFVVVVVTIAIFLPDGRRGRQPEHDPGDYLGRDLHRLVGGVCTACDIRRLVHGAAVACASPMELRPDQIVRTDFPSARRGYDPGAVDAHLRAIAEAVERLRAQPQGSAAGMAAQRVEAIIAAAEESARQIEEGARADAAVHVERAEDTADQLAARAAELEKQIAQVVAQLGLLRTGVVALAGDLSAPAPAPAVVPEPFAEPAAMPGLEAEPVALQAVPDPEPEAAPRAPEGARLIALNMALSGTPREETARYLRENYDLENQDALLDDVYAKAGG